ncbi:MAG: hypothetical protein AAGN66_27470, partial [Acidobacteriota bacterium]
MSAGPSTPDSAPPKPTDQEPDGLGESATRELRPEVRNPEPRDSAGAGLVGAAEELESLGPYRIEKLIGRGGMGEVYQAWDPRLERRVAIKHIRAEAAENPVTRERLRREARAVAGLSHGAIVQ